jgi:hypothetical protein
MPVMTSMPAVTWPKFVYCLSRNVESFFTTSHYPENPYDEPVIAVVARNDPEEQEHVVPFHD